MTEVEQPPQNGIDLSTAEEEDSSKARPADIEQDMREMERRKRVEAIMGSKLFREELERIVDCARDSGNAAGILQQLSDIVGVPSTRVGSVFKTSSCMLPINDIRGVESMGYAKGEKILRCKLAATFRLLDLYGWTQGLGAQITARLKVDQEYFLVNPYGLLYHEITASSLNKVDMQGNIVEQGTTNFGVNKSHFALHSTVHAARPDIRCAIYIGCSPVVAISSLKTGLLPLTKDACVLGELTTYSYTGYLHDEEERNKLVRNLGPNSKVMLLTNHGALCCGETIEEAFFAACHIVQACETQLKLLPVGLDNLVLIPEESRKTIYDQSRRPPEDLEKKFAATTITDSNKSEEDKKEGGETATKVIGQTPKWRVGGAEFEALMRMLDNAGYRTGYIYRHPLIKSEPPKPKNDVELPPAVSSLGYLLEEEELFRQGIWKKGDLRKGGDRSRWLNSPNVYQKVEVLETGTPDPKKITKWVAEGSPTHSTPVRIDDPLQFVPVNTNPKEFKRVQQQIKDNRRADKISAGPQSHILEGVTWDEANRIKDATVSSAGDHVVLMGAASKGIIQRGFQHNATVYKAPYAKNPFDNVTDDELNEYKRTVERKKKSIHGEYTDTDFSESEALSSLQTSGAQQQTKQTNTTTTTTTAAVSQSEPEDISEHQVMRIQTEQAPVPSQPEVVLSDASLSFINGERSHSATNRKPPTGRDIQFLMKSNQAPQNHNIHELFGVVLNSSSINQYQSAIEGGDSGKEEEQKSYSFTNSQANDFKLPSKNLKLTHNVMNNSPFRNKTEMPNTNHPLTYTNTNTQLHSSKNQGNGNLSNVEDRMHYRRSCIAHNSNNTPKLEIKNDFKNYFENVGLVKGKFSICSSPEICNKIFKSVFNGKCFRNQFKFKGIKKLKSNINLFDEKSISKLNSPYRTVSHFGLNTPKRDPQPAHKHLAFNIENEQKYVPLKRSVSYEEIFSSPRYLNLCEYCFELVVRLKPELMCKTKLHNMAECSFSCFSLSSGEKQFTDTSNRTNNTLHEEEYYLSDLTEPSYSIFSLQLDPLTEVEEVKSSNENVFASYVTNSTFNDKLARINYSQLYSNINYNNNASNIVSSKISSTKGSVLKTPNYITGINCDISTAATNISKKSEDFDSTSNNKNCEVFLNEMYELNKWTDVASDKMQVTTNTNRFENFENTVKIKNFKKLMSREERSRRKLEFQELWEDHVRSAKPEHFQNVIEHKSTESSINKTLTKLVNAINVADKSSLLQGEKSNVVEDIKTTFNSDQQNLGHDSSFSMSISDDINGSNEATENNKPRYCKISANFSENVLQGLPNSRQECPTNIDNLSPLELTILEKIEINDLSKSEEIFGKIETTIRNKITPSELELIVREQVLLLDDKNENTENNNKGLMRKSLFLLSSDIKDNYIQQSHSLPTLNINSSTPMHKSKKSPSFPNEGHQNILEQTKLYNKPTNTYSYIKKSHTNRHTKSRNFILENIRNVSISRQSAQINSHSLSSSCMTDCENKLPKNLGYTPKKRKQLVSHSNSSSSTVYSFQSKLVKGSPKFWITMSQRSTKKSQSPSLVNFNTVKTAVKQDHNNCSIERVVGIETNTNLVNNVDAEINALGKEIQQIQPRLEKYKLKLDDFGQRVADCVNNINECVATQENIATVEQELKYCRKLNQYSDEITCRMQTFSLSETED